MIKHGLVVGVLSLSSWMAYGWGSVGHKTSAKVAWALLDKQTQERVLQVLDGGDIADASVWPDEARARPEWKFSIWFHFEKIPDNTTYLDNLKTQDPAVRQLGGLIEALYVAEDVMKNPQSTAADKSAALKFVIHCIGDLHQPLHSGRVEDKGGNKIPVKWLGFDTNLHAVWDGQMIYLGRKEILKPKDVVDAANDQNQNYADFLLTKYKDFRPDENTFSRYDEWIHEAMIPRTEAYDLKNMSEEEYTAHFIDTIDKQVYMAGLRIAHVLTRLVYQQPSTNPLDTLRNAIVSIVGDFTRFVVLKPRPAVAQPPVIPVPTPGPTVTPTPMPTQPEPPTPVPAWPQYAGW